MQIFKKKFQKNNHFLLDLIRIADKDIADYAIGVPSIKVCGDDVDVVVHLRHYHLSFISFSSMQPTSSS